MAVPVEADDEASEVLDRSFGAAASAIAEAVASRLGVRSRDDALDLAIRQSYARRTRRLRLVPPDRLTLSWCGWPSKTNRSLMFHLVRSAFW